MVSPQPKSLRRYMNKTDRPYQYQKQGCYYAMVTGGLKEAGVAELVELGAQAVKPDHSGILFKAKPATLYRINYCSRLLSRCLAPLTGFRCDTTDRLYRLSKNMRWEHFFSSERTFAVSAHVSDSTISHSKFAALRLKDAIADYFRVREGRRPSVSVRNPDILFNLHIRHNQATISVDTSGGALHRRGYREETVSAPIQETIAAAMIHYSQLDGTMPLYDPMCGSGTLLCEALMAYCRIPAGIFKNQFGFECLPDFEPLVWREVKKQADRQIRDLPKGLIAGSDIDKKAVDVAKTNLMGIHFGNQVAVKRADFRKLPSLENHVIVTNPPYGIRMGKDQDLGLFYKALGDFLKQKCKGAVAYIFFGERQLIKRIGLKPSWKKPIRSGGLDGRLVKYEMY